MKTVIGIDLSAPTNPGGTVAVLLEEQGSSLHLREAVEGADDVRISRFTHAPAQMGDVFVGLDAPLSYSTTGGDRPSDAALRERLTELGVGNTVMAPAAPGMKWLTMRGLFVSRHLTTLCSTIHVVEVHPTACLALRGASIADIRNMKGIDSAPRLALLSWLRSKGVHGLPAADVSHHYVAACAAALAAWKWSLRDTVWLHRAVPIEHPYDFVC